MIIVYGTRLYGHADEIEGTGHVACRFVHIMFVPLIPIETVFVLDDDRGVKLPFSFKAAMSGWLRGGALLAGLGAFGGAIASFVEGEPLAGIVLAVVGVVSVAAFFVFGRAFAGCSPSRRAELLGLLGMGNEDGQHAPPVQPQFGYVAPAAQPPYAAGPAHGAAAAYGAPPAGPAYGAAAAYGAPPAGPHGYGAPPPGPQGYGAPPPGPQGYGAPPPGPQGYGAPPQPNYGAPPQPNYGAPPAGGFGGPSAPPYPQAGAPFGPGPQRR